LLGRTGLARGGQDGAGWQNGLRRVAVSWGDSMPNAAAAPYRSAPRPVCPVLPHPRADRAGWQRGLRRIAAVCLDAECPLPRPAAPRRRPSAPSCLTPGQIGQVGSVGLGELRCLARFEAYCPLPRPAAPRRRPSARLPVCPVLPSLLPTPVCPPAPACPTAGQIGQVGRTGLGELRCLARFEAYCPLPRPAALRRGPPARLPGLPSFSRLPIPPPIPPLDIPTPRPYIY
jgi:hypothetical protein